MNKLEQYLEITRKVISRCKLEHLVTAKIIEDVDEDNPSQPVTRKIGLFLIHERPPDKPHHTFKVVTIHYGPMVYSHFTKLEHRLTLSEMLPEAPDGWIATLEKLENGEVMIDPSCHIREYGDFTSTLSRAMQYLVEWLVHQYASPFFVKPNQGEEVEAIAQ